MIGRLALRMPPSGSNTDMIPSGTPTPGAWLMDWAGERGGRLGMEAYR